MGYDMSIAAMSVSMHNIETSQQLDTAVLKMAMDTQTSGLEELLETMEPVDISAMTGIGGLVDLLA